MDQRVKTLWVTALRSGEYEQGRHTLRKGDQFCCLGVLCDLAVKEGVIPAPVAGLSVDDRQVWTYGEADTLLPHEVVAWAQLFQSDPVVTWPTSDWGYTKIGLSGVNDYHGESGDHPGTFEVIAGLIEDQL